METFCWLVPLMLYADFLCTGLFLHFFCKNFEELNDLHGTFQLMSLFEAIFHHPGGCWSPLIRTSTYHINDSVVIFFFSIHKIMISKLYQETTLAYFKTASANTLKKGEKIETAFINISFLWFLHM